ncbi:MAG: hypothetical protein Q8P54_01710, partial [bacterium]|nr:hypothetical protein [bacterium]
KLNVYYQPRNDLSAATKHLYGRGPLFVDYYSKPGTKYFPLLISIYLVSAGLFLTAVFQPDILYWILASLGVLIILTALVISQSIKDFLISIIGVPLIGLIFSLGVLKGTLLRAKGLIRR